MTVTAVTAWSMTDGHDGHSCHSLEHDGHDGHDGHLLPDPLLLELLEEDRDLLLVLGLQQGTVLLVVLGDNCGGGCGGGDDSGSDDSGNDDISDFLSSFYPYEMHFFVSFCANSFYLNFFTAQKCLRYIVAVMIDGSDDRYEQRL